MGNRYEKYERFSVSFPHSHLLEVIFQGIGRGNACDSKAHHEMAEIWKDIAADPDVNAVVVRGAGDAFCAGGHMSFVEDLGTDFDLVMRTTAEARDIVYNMLNCSKPSVAAMRGPVAGAGLAMALMADITVASKTARINDAHVKLGVVAGDHAVIIWPLLCGMGKAK